MQRPPATRLPSWPTPSLAPLLGALVLTACGAQDGDSAADAAAADPRAGAAPAPGDSTPAPGPEGSPPAAANWDGPWIPDPVRTALGPWKEGLRGFPDRASAMGLDYVNHSGEASKPTILEANGAGVAVLDLGGDGDDDLVFSQGLGSLAALRSGPGADLAVFTNVEREHFERAAGPGLDGWWTGLASGDVDGDGDADLVAGAFGDLVLCLQTADGRLAPERDTGLLPSGDERPGARFVPGAERAPGLPPLWATSLALFDGDRDGQLDLFVGQYLDLDPLAPPVGELGEGALAVPCLWKGREVFCGPHGLPPQPDRVLRGHGDGTFEDVSARWLAGIDAGFTLAVGPFDADSDGDTDLYIANDSVANQLLINDLAATDRFVDHAATAGVAVGSEGRAEAGMGVAIGDVDRDGRLDLAVTNYSDEPTRLYLGARQGFAPQTHRVGLANASRRFLSWGVHLEDFDGDGWLELFTANGHVFPQADDGSTGTRYAQEDALWRIAPAERVERVAPLVRDSILAARRGTRGSAVGDFDGDGAPDLALAHLDAPAALGMNRLAPANRLWIRCLGPLERGTGDGPRTPRDGMGTQVVVVTRDAAGVEYGLIGEVQTSEGFQSSSTPWLHFGLGAASRYEAIHVRWPSGRRQELPGGLAGRRLWIREGVGLERTEVFP